MAADDTRQLPPLGAEAGDRLNRLGRMPFNGQLAALIRGDYTSADWRSIHTPTERLELLFRLDHDQQFESLRAACFSLTEWCTFASRYPQRVLMLHREFCFITVTTPEWCER